MNDCTACIVTRGDVPLDEIQESLRPFGCEIHVWNDSLAGEPSGVAGRYVAIAEATTQFVLLQDDDCVLEQGAIVELGAAWEFNRLVVNMPSAFRHDFYDDHNLVGFGAFAERRLILGAFQHAVHHWPGDPRGSEFERTCDIAVTYLLRNQTIRVDVPYRNLEWASAPNRMWKQETHVAERKRTLEWVRTIPELP